MGSPKRKTATQPLCFMQKKTMRRLGEFRLDQSFDNGLALWVAGDQLWKGAALNAIQIAETLVERKCLKWMYIL